MNCNYLGTIYYYFAVFFLFFVYVFCTKSTKILYSIFIKKLISFDKITSFTKKNKTFFLRQKNLLFCIGCPIELENFNYLRIICCCLFFCLSFFSCFCVCFFIQKVHSQNLFSLLLFFHLFLFTKLLCFTEFIF